jgi:hypothetical protein
MKVLDFLKGFGLLFLITIITSCSDQNTNTGVEKNLIGTWSWVSSSGGIAGTTNSPASTGKNIDLKFTSDNKYFYYTNGVISSQGTYKLSTEKSIVDGTNKSSIVFSADGERVIDKIDNTNLYLSDNYYDGFSSSYIRK